MFSFLPYKNNKYPSEKNLRHIIATDWLKSIPEGSKILDAGAGRRIYSPHCHHLDYTSQDLGQFNGELENGEKYEWDSQSCDIICDIIDIPCDDNTFDYILCTEVFEHLPDPARAIKEFSRIINNHGKILITCPFNCGYHQEPYFFSSGYSRYWFEHFSAMYDFQICDLLEYGSYFTQLQFHLNRFWNISGCPEMREATGAFIQKLNENIESIRSVVPKQPEAIYVLLEKT